MIEFFVPGTPIAQPRPKVSTQGGFARAYVDRTHPIHSWRHAVALAGAAALRGAKASKLEGPLSLELTLFMPRPKGHMGTGRNAGKVRPSAPQYPAVKPDIDNGAKAIQDALDGVLWVDDAQVVELHAAKLYADSRPPGLQEPGALVKVRRVEEVAA